MTRTNIAQLIKKLDTTEVLQSAGSLGDQIEHVWQQVQGFAPDLFVGSVKNVVVFGMGGSALGAHIVQSLYGAEFTVPFLFVSGYEVPGFVGSGTIAIFSSYSGTTEEVLGVVAECKKRGAHLLGITTGGRLAKLLGKQAFVFDPKYNPSGHPRFGGGYMIFGLLGLCQKMGLLRVSREEIVAAAMLGRSESKKYSPLTANNRANMHAKKLKGFTIVIVASEFLQGNAHIFANQCNETSKNFAAYFSLPELNHHLMEGLKFPRSNKKDLTFVFLESNLYSPRVRLRYPITKDVVKKNDVRVESISLIGKTKLLQVVEMLTFGSFVSFYLALLHNVDPGDIKWVDYFKSKIPAPE